MSRWVKNLIILVCSIFLTIAIFRPRNDFPPEDREKAIGLDLLSDPKVKRFFVPGQDFDPLEAPQPGDWLAVNLEPGQSFVSYQNSRAVNPFSAPKNVLYLQPIGEVEADGSPSVLVLQNFAEAFFQAKVIVRSTLAWEKTAFTSRVNSHSMKKQLLTTDILDFIQKDVPDDAYCLQAITMVDLYPGPSWNFVFGEATLQSRVGVLSFARYNPEFHGEERRENSARILLRRAGKVMVHEMGHMFGIYHCVYYNCVMNGSNHLQKSDRRPMTLCPVCLRKLHHQVRFDVEKRYIDLEKWFRENQLNKDADWVKTRLQSIGSG